MGLTSPRPYIEDPFDVFLDRCKEELAVQSERVDMMSAPDVMSACIPVAARPRAPPAGCPRYVHAFIMATIIGRPG